MKFFRIGCPCEILGYTCHRFSPFHNFKCNECGRELKPARRVKVS